MPKKSLETSQIDFFIKDSEQRKLARNVIEDLLKGIGVEIVGEPKITSRSLRIEVAGDPVDNDNTPESIMLEFHRRGVSVNSSAIIAKVNFFRKIADILC